MRPVLYLLSFLMVLGSAFWAYRENYATQTKLKDVAALQDEIATLHEAIALQRAEWAYLNRPARLRELATINFDRLGLLPMEPEQFGTSAQIAYPEPPTLIITGTTDTMGALDRTDIIAAGAQAQIP
ncbi:MAG: cell division protein FtsL [Alphaproteobacteria bacterium]|jgi:hypothetical protein